MREHGCVADQLVNNIWFWSVFWACGVPDVLRRVEYSESEAVQEFTSRQKTADWFESPACLSLEEL